MATRMYLNRVLHEHFHKQPKSNLRSTGILLTIHRKNLHY